MSLSSAQTAEVINTFKRSENDTGSTEVQVSLLTTRIKTLTEHFKAHKKDNHSRRGLLALVNQRKSLLKYLKGRDQKRYYDLIEALSLRDTF